MSYRVMMMYRDVIEYIMNGVIPADNYIYQ